MEFLVVFFLLGSPSAYSNFLEKPAKSYGAYKSFTFPGRSFLNPSNFPVFSPHQFYTFPVGHFVNSKSATVFSKPLPPFIPAPITEVSTEPGTLDPAVEIKPQFSRSGPSVGRYEVSSIDGPQTLSPQSYVELSPPSSVIEEYKVGNVHKNIPTTPAPVISGLDTVIKQALEKRFKPYGGKVHVYKNDDMKMPVSTYDVGKSKFMNKEVEIDLQFSRSGPSVSQYKVLGIDKVQTIAPGAHVEQTTVRRVSPVISDHIKAYQVDSLYMNILATTAPVISALNPVVKKSLEKPLKTYDMKMPVSTYEVGKSGILKKRVKINPKFSRTGPSVGQYKVSAIDKVQTLPPGAHVEQATVRPVSLVTSSPIKEYEVDNLHMNNLATFAPVISGPNLIINKSLDSQLKTSVYEVRTLKNNDVKTPVSTYEVEMSEFMNKMEIIQKSHPIGGSVGQYKVSGIDTVKALSPQLYVEKNTVRPVSQVSRHIKEYEVDNLDMNILATPKISGPSTLTTESLEKLLKTSGGEVNTDINHDMKMPVSTYDVEKSGILNKVKIDPQFSGSGPSVGQYKVQTLAPGEHVEQTTVSLVIFSHIKEYEVANVDINILSTLAPVISGPNRKIKYFRDQLKTAGEEFYAYKNDDVKIPVSTYEVEMSEFMNKMKIIQKSYPNGASIGQYKVSEINTVQSLAPRLHVKQTTVLPVTKNRIKEYKVGNVNMNIRATPVPVVSGHNTVIKETLEKALKTYGGEGHMYNDDLKMPVSTYEILNSKFMKKEMVQPICKCLTPEVPQKVVLPKIPISTYGVNPVVVPEIERPISQVVESPSPVVSYMVDYITEPSTPAVIKNTVGPVKSVGNNYYFFKSVPQYPMVPKSSLSQFGFPYMQPAHKSVFPLSGFVL